MAHGAGVLCALWVAGVIIASHGCRRHTPLSLTGGALTKLAF